MKYSFVILLFCFSIKHLNAQFAPAAGLQGSTAIYKSDIVFKAWATGCSITRGYQDIANTALGLASVGDTLSAIGLPGQNGVVSLGDGGTATLTFAQPITNKEGFDFAIFENGFMISNADSVNAFLELAFVEVSSNGIDFYRFPATSTVQDTFQIPMTGIDCAQINNLAGKYIAGYGTPFDLEELKNEIGLDVTRITHMRVHDVVGSIDSLYATRDQFGTKINDPYPTAFPSSGFDLDAVGVIHIAADSGVSSIPINSTTDLQFAVLPNPAAFENVTITLSPQLLNRKLNVTNVTGQTLSIIEITQQSFSLDISKYSAGMYLVSIQLEDKLLTKKLIIK